MVLTSMHRAGGLKESFRPTDITGYQTLRGVPMRVFESKKQQQAPLTRPPSAGEVAAAAVPDLVANLQAR